MPRKPPIGKSLAEVNPELAKEWHPTKNGEMTPLDYVVGSAEKVWWKCEKGKDHEWLTAIRQRAKKNSSCPVCSGHKIVKSNSLGVLKPEVVEFWHPTKNKGISPFLVSPFSNKKNYWRCSKGEDHEFERSPNQWKKNSGCPICSGRKIVKSNCMATTHPELTKQWHPAKNGDLTPEKIVSGYGKRVWWKCPKGDDHEWKSTPNNRTQKNSGCPICNGNITVKSNSLLVQNYELALEWHPTKNSPKEPVNVHVNSHSNAWWVCKKNRNHVWQAKVMSRNYKETGCPYCANLKVDDSNSLTSLFPIIASEWHPTKNSGVTSDVVGSGSSKKYWWKCSAGEDHEWEASVSKRTRGRGCPVCAGQKVVRSNSLEYTDPDLLKEWNFSRNIDINPNEITSGSSRRTIWWKCTKNTNHEWKASPSARKRGRGCPYCTGKRVNETNSLESLRPEIAAQWHPSKNGHIKPDSVTLGSGKLAWWKCPEGSDHEWRSSIVNRINKNSGCPICQNILIVDSNCLQTVNPDLARQWHPTKNGKLTPKIFGAGAHKKVWWKCPKGDDHEWPATIVNRNRGKGCPFCTLTPQSRQELTISFELAQFFTINPKGFKTRKTGRLWSIDIYIPELTLGIEFDGSYWHKDKRALDKLKTEQLKDEGFQIMRIREEPLKAITDIDVVSKKPFNAKHVADDILKHILNEYILEKEKIDLIKLYLRKKTIQNEQGLEDYIEQILTEKAERKKK